MQAIVPAGGARVIVSRDDGTKLFTGYLAEAPAYEYLGWGERGPGYRYTTVQVWDCIAEYDGILARGGTSGGEPRILGETVRYAFVCDPDGNHIEISQRATLTGGHL